MELYPNSICFFHIFSEPPVVSSPISNHGHRCRKVVSSEDAEFTEKLRANESTNTVDDIWNEYGDKILFEGRVIPASSDIMREIAKKMGKTAKAVQLLLKRKYEKTYSMHTVHSQTSAQTDKSMQTLAVDDIWNEYGDNILFDGSVLPASSAIMKEIAQKMGKTPKAVQLLLRKKYAASEEERENGKEDENEKENEKQTLGDNTLDYFSEKFHKEGTDIFEVEERRTKHRDKIVYRQVLKIGWTSKLAQFLWEKTKLSCKFTFKASYVTSDGEINVKGNCECGSVLDIRCRKSDLSVDIKNIMKHFQHTRRYQASGEMKKILVENLKHSSALKVQANRINELIPNNETLETGSFVRSSFANT